MLLTRCFTKTIVCWSMSLAVSQKRWSPVLRARRWVQDTREGKSRAILRVAKVDRQGFNCAPIPPQDYPGHFSETGTIQKVILSCRISSHQSSGNCVVCISTGWGLLLLFDWRRLVERAEITIVYPPSKAPHSLEYSFSFASACPEHSWGFVQYKQKNGDTAVYLFGGNARVVQNAIGRKNNRAVVSPICEGMFLLQLGFPSDHV